MARNALISEQRFTRIMKRQQKSRWLSEYEPAMLATRDEAPKISRPSTAYAGKLGRQMHFMSLAERHVCLLALYHPAVFDIHEQHMLHPFEANHPLDGLPQAARMSLPRLRGTVTVAEELGMLSKHPVVWLAGRTKAAEPTRHAFPYLGDLLLFLRDEHGPYCVNWSVKARRIDFFDTAQPSSKAVTPTESTQPALSMRHQLERQYFADVDICTHFVAAEDLNLSVLVNLQTLFVRAQQHFGLTQEKQELLVLAYQRLVGTKTTVLSQLPDLMERFECDRSQCLIALYHAVWERRLRVDLFQPVLVDKPLSEERTDILVQYAHLFGR
ncbi:hypothetical protein [Eoetvoesiella caeni]|nr:hypothetical protein [Eoetvoesiella caeni]MCI2811000.1 hypothetical protein [Eoetvoesiella caeni]NYT56899.1 hypothetical protein [Eoetvoesiella caeni]